MKRLTLLTLIALIAGILMSGCSDSGTEPSKKLLMDIEVKSLDVLNDGIFWGDNSFTYQFGLVEINSESIMKDKNNNDVGHVVNKPIKAGTNENISIGKEYYGIKLNDDENHTYSFAFLMYDENGDSAGRNAIIFEYPFDSWVSKGSHTYSLYLKDPVDTDIEIRVNLRIKLFYE